MLASGGAVLVALLVLGTMSTSASVVRPAHHETDRMPRTVSLPKVDRLPLEVIPHHYDISLTPDFVANEFQGFVRIEVSVNEQMNPMTNKITLHAGNTLTIEEQDVTVYYHDAESGPVAVAVSSFETDADREFRIIQLVEEVSNNLTVEISFTGRFGTDMVGFYVSTYQVGSVTKYLAATQFESTTARRAFPCFDEPALKATFRMTMSVPEGYRALFNTNPEDITTTTEEPSTISVTPDNVTPLKTVKKVTPPYQKSLATRQVAQPTDLSSVSFETTRRMSTYLVAFLVYDEGTFDFDELPATETQGRQRVWSRRDLADQRGFALEVGAAALSAYGRLFPDFFVYMNDKMDQVAIPDFSAGAMENWGLVNYREQRLLVDRSESTVDSMRSAAMTVTHELAHMWFGDFVTLDFWNVLWLNEGFASYWAYHVDLGQITEGWRLRDQFLVQETAVALDADAVENTHALTTEEDTQVPGDDVTYNKGGALLRMFSYWIGEDEFYNRLDDYLRSHQYDRVTPSDLFTALAEGDLANHMETWTVTPGYPVINVSRDGDTATLSQSRYLLTPSADADMTAKWPTLVSYTSGAEFTGDSVKTVWVMGDQEATIQELVDGEPLYLNLNWTGFYRVNYDTASWHMLHHQLTSDHTLVPRQTRAQLLCDAFSLARSGHIEYQLALDISQYLAQEEDYLPWAITFRALDFLDTVLAPTEHYADFKTYLNNLLVLPYSLVTFSVLPDDDHILRQRRVGVLKHACHAEYEPCIQSANELAADAFPSDSQKAISVEPDLRSTAYCVWAQDNDLWASLWEQYLTTTVATEKAEVITALGCSQDEETLKQYLSYTLDSTLVRPQDLQAVFSAVYSTPLGLQVAIDFIKGNAAVLLEQPSILQNIISGLGSKVVTDDQLEQLSSLSETPELESVLGTIEAAVATGQTQVDWVGANVHQIGSWLSNAVGNSAALPVGASHAFVWATVLAAYMQHVRL